MTTAVKLSIPAQGEKIIIKANGALEIPNHPIIPFIEGDGIGPDIWRAASRVLDAAVQKNYSGKRKIEWMEIYAGEKSNTQFGSWLPDETLEAISEYKVAIKGPLTTPVGGGIRSLNVTLRQKLDLYACVRPVRYFQGVSSPVKRPELVDMVIFRENMEDVYAGYEWKKGDENNRKLREFLAKELGVKIREDAGIGLKPMSEYGSQRLVRRAIRYAIAKKRKSITLVHKGNIMKFTEGAFRDWGYELAKKEFKDQVVLEKEIVGEKPKDKVIMNDCIADAMFQQVLLRPQDYDVIATPNLNGDYLSDALLAQVGGLGLGPGANIGDGCALFEATHGTAPKYANQDKVNPSSVLLSGVMMLEHMNWDEAAHAIVRSLEKTIQQKRVTYDLARQMEGAQTLKCSEFANALIENLS